MLAHSLLAQTTTTVPTWVLLVGPLVVGATAITVPWITQFFTSRNAREQRTHETYEQDRISRANAYSQYASAVTAMVSRVKMVPPLGTPSPDEVVNVLQPLIITAMTKYFDAYLQTRDGNVRNRLDATHDEVKAFVNYVVDLSL